MPGAGTEIISNSRINRKRLALQLFIVGNQEVRTQLQTSLDNYECIEEKVLSLSANVRGGMGQGKVYREGAEMSTEG